MRVILVGGGLPRTLFFGLSPLNHPNIAQIYGLEEVAPRSTAAMPSAALVLELVDGRTLADRLAQGPLLLDDTMAIARQIADALESAHECGIIHRDLKPANVKVKEDGTVQEMASDEELQERSGN